MKSVLIPVLLSTLALLGCSSSESSNPSADVTKGTPAVTEADCVICVNHRIEVTASTPHVSHAGKDYYFCADECRQVFVKDPARAIAKYESAKAPSAPKPN